MKKEYIACCCDGMMMHETHPLDEISARKAVVDFMRAGYFGFYFSADEVRRATTSKNGYLCFLTRNPLEKATPMFFKNVSVDRMETLLYNSNAGLITRITVKNHTRVAAVSIYREAGR